MNEFIMILITTASEEEALKIADHLVEEKLAADGQISGPITSIFEWKGKKETTKEWQCQFKTRAALYKKVEKTIKEHHSYEVPQIVALPIIDGSRDYLDWLKMSVRV
ncbi:MAG: divalent-cation tolerance protein CutA [bacterium]|nr:divalent-cation tolerance protein CutA [bacterium]